MKFKRLIASVLVKNGIVVQSINFRKFLPIGKPSYVVKYLADWGIDEILILDIDATKEKRSFDLDILKNISGKSFIPITAGGGINSLDCAKEIISEGADKISLNNALIYNPELVTKIAEVLGDQSVVASVNFIKNKINNTFNVFDYSTNQNLDIDVLEFCLRVQNLGVGEIHLNSVDNDGQYNGFIVSVSDLIAKNCSVPIIASGGAGKSDHFKEIFSNGNISAASAGNFWNFFEHSVACVKQDLFQSGITGIRLEKEKYLSEQHFDLSSRIKAPSEEYLNELNFSRIIKVKI